MSRNDLYNLIASLVMLAFVDVLCAMVFRQYSKEYEQKEGIWFEAVKHLAEQLGMTQPVIGIYPSLKSACGWDGRRICLAPRLIDILGTEKVQALIACDMCRLKLYSSPDRSDVLTVSLAFLGMIAYVVFIYFPLTVRWSKSLPFTWEILLIAGLLAALAFYIRTVQAYFVRRIIKRRIAADKMAAERFARPETIVSALEEQLSLRLRNKKGFLSDSQRRSKTIANQRVAALTRIIEQEVVTPQPDS